MSDETPQMFDLSALPQDAPTVGITKTATVLHLPLEADSPEWDEFYTKLGRPTTAQEYTYTAPEDFEVDPKMLDTLREVAHKQGLTAKQFDAILTSYVGKQVEVFAELEKADEEQNLNEELTRRANLTKILGDDPDTVLSNAGKAFRAIGIPELGEAFRTNPALHQPEIYQLLAGVGAMFEASTVPGEMARPLSDAMHQTLKKQYEDAEAAYKAKPTDATALAFTMAQLKRKLNK